MPEAEELRIDGSVTSGFEPVRDAFVENFTRRGELGAACCIYRDGEKVGDLWGGVRDRASGEPWRTDTMAVVHSTTKGLAAMVMALTHSRGWLDYDELVCTYWPEFAQAGKEHITVRQLLAHQAGLFAFDEKVDRAVGLRHRRRGQDRAGRDLLASRSRDAGRRHYVDPPSRRLAVESQVLPARRVRSGDLRRDRARARSRARLRLGRGGLRATRGARGRVPRRLFSGTDHDEGRHTQLAQLRYIDNVVRLGHVERIDLDEIVLEHGTISTSPDHLHVHCAAHGLSDRPPVAIFTDETITLHVLSRISLCMSSALTGFVDASDRTTAEKNRLCRPNPWPQIPSIFSARSCWGSRPSWDGRTLTSAPGSMRRV